MIVQCYSDGSAMTKGTPGGWGSVIVVDGRIYREISGYLESATNNDAELIAAINGLECVLDFLSTMQGSFPLEYEVTLISDSEIILNWANGAYRFKQTEKLPLYDRLRHLVKKMKVKTQWVKGHSGNVYNERCDRLANMARKGTPKDLDKPNSIVDTRIGKKKDGTASVWYGNQLRVIDFDNNVIEVYNREVHGKRGSLIEIRKGKDR